MGTQGRPAWVVWGLIGYIVLVGIVVFSPVSYGEIVAAIGSWIREGLGITFFGTGWIEFVANIAMFIPLGLLLTLMIRRHWWGVALSLVLSAGVELVQAIIPSRVTSVRDVLANTLGAAVGAALAWLIVARREPRDEPAAVREAGPTSRRSST